MGTCLNYYEALDGNLTMLSYEALVAMAVNQTGLPYAYRMCHLVDNQYCLSSDVIFCGPPPAPPPPSPPPPSPPPSPPPPSPPPSPPPPLPATPNTPPKPPPTPPSPPYIPAVDPSTPPASPPPR